MPSLSEIATATAGVGLNLASPALVLLALVALIKIWPALKKFKTESDASLRNDLLLRVATLEAQVNLLLVQREARDKEHAIETADLRHQLRNETSSLDMLLNMIELAPDRIPECVTRAVEYRKYKALEIATERGKRRSDAAAIAVDEEETV